MKNLTIFLLSVFLLALSFNTFAQKPGTPDYLLVKEDLRSLSWENLLINIGRM